MCDFQTVTMGGKIVPPELPEGWEPLGGIDFNVSAGAPPSYAVLPFRILRNPAECQQCLALPASPIVLSAHGEVEVWIQLPGGEGAWYTIDGRRRTRAQLATKLAALHQDHCAAVGAQGGAVPSLAGLGLVRLWTVSPNRFFCQLTRQILRQQ